MQVYRNTRLNNEINLGDNLPILYQTQFGWVAMGQYTPLTTNSLTASLLPLTGTYEQIPSLWEIETPKNTGLISAEDKIVEQHFNNTIKRNSQGRFVIELPKSKNVQELGEVLYIAKQRFYSLEQKFRKDHEFFIQY